uniref:Transmembrane protein 230 n=1 Tax=Panagrolaimus superbus TaxID=310955 RepID=A0A914Z0V9_9BILA
MFSANSIILKSKMSVFNTGHQRNNSAGEHLIGNCDDCESTPGPYAETVYSGTLPSMRYSAAGSVPDDCSSYYGPPACADEEEEYKGCLCKDANLRANIRVIIGSILLTIIGTALFAFGFFVMVFANEIDVHGWIFSLVGVLFFIPGFYHIVYISCTVLGREGYSFNNLSTFRRPPR